MTQSPYTGQRFPFQGMVGGQRGGMMSEPYSGVVSGLIVSTGTITADACPLTITAGSARLDGQLCTLANNITGLSLIGGTGMFSSNGTYGPFAVYLRPRRRVPTVLTAPSGSAAQGDMRLQVQSRSHPQLGNYEEFVNLWVYRGSAWQIGNAFEAPPSAGQNNSPFNDVNPQIDAATTNNASFFLSPELPVYFPSPVIDAPNQGINFLRRSASVLLALVSVVVNGNNRTATVTTYSEFEIVPL